MEEAKKIWLDGDLVDWASAQTHILTHTFHYGGGVFEGIRAYNTSKGPAVFRLKEHISRFFYSAQCLEMEIPFSKGEVESAILETIKANKIEECYIRPIAYFSYEKMGLNPAGIPVSAAIAAWPWGAYLEKKIVSVKISPYTRLHPKSIISDAKICGYYVNSILASQDAKKTGFDEAVLLDFEGNIAEGPGENIFIKKGDKLQTPKKGNILPGITRDSVIKIAEDLGIETEEKIITIEDLKSADEAFFCGTAVEICAIGRIDDVILNQEKVGKTTQKIKEIYQKAIFGQEEKYFDWLTFV